MVQTKGSTIISDNGKAATSDNNTTQNILQADANLHISMDSMNTSDKKKKKGAKSGNVRRKSSSVFDSTCINSENSDNGSLEHKTTLVKPSVNLTAAIHSMLPNLKEVLTYVPPAMFLQAK
eukprot:Awhi_evm1s12693